MVLWLWVWVHEHCVSDSQYWVLPLQSESVQLSALRACVTQHTVPVQYTFYFYTRTHTHAHTTPYYEKLMHRGTHHHVSHTYFDDGWEREDKRERENSAGNTTPDFSTLCDFEEASSYIITATLMHKEYPYINYIHWFTLYFIKFDLMK